SLALRPARIVISCGTQLCCDEAESLSSASSSVTGTLSGRSFTHSRNNAVKTSMPIPATRLMFSPSAFARSASEVNPSPSTVNTIPYTPINSAMTSRTSNAPAVRLGVSLPTVSSLMGRLLEDDVQDDREDQDDARQQARVAVPARILTHRRALELFLRGQRVD